MQEEKLRAKQLLQPDENDDKGAKNTSTSLRGKASKSLRFANTTCTKLYPQLISPLERPWLVAFHRKSRGQ